jgi:uncharacterized membrane protein (UPF0127 family)
MLRVENLTHACTVVESGRVANNPWTRFRGLMGVRDLPPGDGMLITPCSSIHCMWMAIPIDVVYCDREGHVVAIDAELKPWRIGRLHRGVHSVIELPAGQAAATGTAPGDRLKITY